MISLNRFSICGFEINKLFWGHQDIFVLCFYFIFLTSYELTSFRRLTISAFLPAKPEEEPLYSLPPDSYPSSIPG